MSGTHLGLLTNSSVVVLFFLRQLRVYWRGAPPLTRGRTCSLQLFAAWPLQRSLSRVRVQRDSLLYFTASSLRLPQPEGQGSCIYLPQEQRSPVIPQGIGVFATVLRKSTSLSRGGIRSGAQDQMFFLSENCGFLDVGAPLMRRWICKLVVQLLLGLARAVTVR
jgi:hypothetical protein